MVAVLWQANHVQICHGKARKVEKNTPFSILGFTQLPYTNRLTARMDQGHGLLDCTNILVPNCLTTPYETKKQLKSVQHTTLKVAKI